MAHQVFIERLYEIEGAEVACRFFAPVEEDGDFRCRYSIDWPSERPRIRDRWEVDGVQALLSAMQSAHCDLLVWREQEGRTVRWLGGNGLGLPISDVIRDLDVGRGSTAPTLE